MKIYAELTGNSKNLKIKNLRDNTTDEKFSVLAKNYFDLIQKCQSLRDDLIVVIMTHLENYGTETDPLYRIWTTGKYFACITPNSVNSKQAAETCMRIPSQAEINCYYFWRV